MLVAGGHSVPTPNGTGSFYEPTLLVDVTPAMHIAQQEVFGPVMVIFRAQNDTEALRIANSSPYGFGCGRGNLLWRRTVFTLRSIFPSTLGVLLSPPPFF